MAYRPLDNYRESSVYFVLSGVFILCFVAFLGGCASVPDPDLSAANHIQLLGDNGPQASVYVDIKQCSYSTIFLRSDFDRASDIMCDGFNAELLKLAKPLGVKVILLPDADFVWRKDKRRDLGTAVSPGRSDEAYRIVVTRWTYYERSNTGSQAATGTFGATAFIYRNSDDTFLQKTYYENSDSGFLDEMADAGRESAQQLVTDLFKQKK